MKSIQLMDDHRAKLIKMIRLFFPEGKVVLFSDQKGANYFHESNEDKIFVVLLNQRGFPLYSPMHWVEFCIFHLIDELYKGENRDTVNEFFWGTVEYIKAQEADEPSDTDVHHPVDILFEEYQKQLILI